MNWKVLLNTIALTDFCVQLHSVLLLYPRYLSWDESICLVLSLSIAGWPFSISRFQSFGELDVFGLEGSDEDAGADFLLSITE